MSRAGAVRIERILRSDHPASRGHFPGNPIIPGAVLLSETVTAIQPGVDPTVAPLLITSAKFQHPARPGDRMLIEFSRTTTGEIRFACTVEGRPVLTGQMSCSAPTAT